MVHFLIRKWYTFKLVYTPYGRFELIDLTKAKDNDTIGYSYEIQFDAYYRKLKNKILKYRPNTGSQESTFSLTSKISTHIEVIMKNLAYYAKLDKSYLYDPNFEGEGTDYTYVIDASVDANAAKLITYSNTSILDAIANIAQTFGCEWWFEGNILHFGTCENTNAITDFRLNDNIVSMSSSQSQSTYANRVYAFGAARNLPSGYKNDADADITKDGVVEKRLMLPNSAECSDKNKQLLAENGFELKNGYIQVSGLREDQYVEGVTTNDDIYPRNLIKTSKVTSYEKDVEDESTPEEGDYIKRTFYRVNSLAIVNEDGEKTGDMAFRKAYILSGKNLHIVFQSGSLNGMDFECEFNPDGVSEILKDDDGNPILKDGKEQINPKSQVFEIVANEDYGRFLPDITLHPKDGDTFVLYNWDSTKLGDTLVSSASNELLTDAIKDLKKSMIDPTTYTCTAEANYSYNQGRGNLHGVGDRVNLYNKGYGDSYRASRIIGYEFCLDIPYDGAKYYVGEKPSYSRLNAMESKIEELVYNGQSYLNGNGGGGKSIYIIKSYDKTAPTDYNVYSAKAVDEQRLNKLKDDTAKGTITWEKVQKFVSGLFVGIFNAENGGSWTPDTEGRSHLITDYLEVHMKAIFEELVIKKNSTIGGKEIISPAGGVAAYKVDEVTVTYNDVSQKAYRCYFLAEQDGDKIDNDFVVEDQVRSESFNLNAGKYHKTGNHFFWRMVIGIDEEPVELDGKKYHYIDLSDTDCATASDVPAKGDVLSQCGNRTDVERQNCLIFSAVDTYSPSIGLYHGINSYSFANKEYVEYGVNKKTNKAFFNVYGDMYVGDRPTKDNGYEGSSYVKYDSATKQVVIKGKLSAKSTVDGKELSQYIKENSAKGLTEEQVNNIINNSQVIADLQNQVDGAIETWFYDGVPTLTNAPASSWTTNKDKDTHLGDLYYDNKTGKAYRFAKDGNTYKWTIITDTDIAKALADASKAQKTADGKMKVFSSQPTPPYQVGDIWVNATYPSDGSTYKNEVLRCQTDKKAGSQFAIADWIKASKYTDDTVANAAKKAAEEAKKAAETAQTNITNLGKTVTINKKAFDSYVKDGYLEPSEIAAMAQDSKRLEDDFAAAEKSYNEVKGAEVLKSTKELTDLNTAFATLTTAKTELVTYLSDISSRYNAADTNGKATIVSAVGTKFTNFQSAYSAFYDKLGLANAYITSKIYGDLKQNITDLAGYKYIKDALGQTTDIDGGLVMTTLLALRDADGNVQSGINGAIDTNRGKKSIATWWGGQMVDKDYNSGSLTPATSLVRFDGSGYLANGAIWWDVDGKVHADPTSFIISEKNLGAYLAFFEPTWKSGSNGTNIKDLVALTPQAPFTTLSVSNDLLVEGKLKLGSITLSVVNGALKIDGDVYSTGGMSAYGDGTNNGGGGGLVASVKSYTDIIKGTYTDNDLASIPNAYAIKALSNRIDNISSELGGLSLDWANITGKPSAFTPSAHTHKWVDITDRITKVSQLTNDSGYTTNKGTVTSVKLTLPTGLSLGTTKEITTSGTFAISLTSGYSIPTTSKQGQWDSAYNWYKLMTTDEETADGVINKWNEVVDFLAGIAQTDSLDSILSGINKSITDETNRAKKAEGANATNIATNKANITTLQGYFTNGSAKSAIKLTNARKLWGNSFDGTADISGSIVVPSGKYITIGNIKLEYDATNKALKITNTSTNEVANLYTSGGVSAYGVGTTSSGSTGGGGLNGTVKSYNDAKSLTSESLSEVASAYSVAALYSSINDAIGRINTLEGGSATSIEVTGSGNAVTGVSKSGTKLTFTKGATFLTSHQDISGKSDKTHTHSVKINGVTKTIAATGGTAVDLGTYLTSHQSLAAYLKSADAEKTYSKLGHTHAFSEITGKPTTLAGYGVTDGVNTVTLSGSGNAVTSASIDGHTLTLTKGSTFSLSGHTHTFASLTSKPTTIAGYGITDAYTKAQVNSTVAKYLPLAGGTITGALTVNGIATFKSKVAIGDIYIINDGSGNLYVQKTDGKTAANFYATGGITAFGASSVSGGTGGGLNGSVLGFEKATAMASADNGDSSKTEVSFLATAWSIKQLNDKINAFGTGVFSDYLTIAAAKATYQPKGSYLTSHQTIYGLTIQKNGTSLGTYTPNSAAKTINVTVPTKLSELSNDSGYTKNTGTVTSVAVSVPTGLSVSGSPITTKGTIAIALASGYSIPTTAKQTNWDKVYNWYTGITATDTDDIINKWQEVIAFLDGISSSTDLNAIVDGINTSISNEVTRAKAAESTLTTNLNAEITRAKSAESTLTTNLNNEITRAKKAENTLNNKFANYLPLAGGTMANKAYITFADSGSFSAGTGAQGDVGGLKWSGQSDYAWLYGSETGSDNFDLTLKFGDDNSNGFRILNKDGNQVIRLSAKGDVASQTVTIGGITLSYDSTNKAIKVNGNIYATGGISAYGASSASSGGGLSGSVLSYDKAIALTEAGDNELSQLASAWSISKLNSRITSLEGGSALNVTTTGSGNAITAISKSGTTITATKGTTFSVNGHTHNYASSVKVGSTSYAVSNNVISLPAYPTIPTSLKNPNALTIQANGTSLGTYDGSAAKTFNLTYSNVGAASASHNHDSVYSKLGHTHDYLVIPVATEDTLNASYSNFQVLYAGGDNGHNGRPSGVDAYSLIRLRTAFGWSGQIMLANNGDLYTRSAANADIKATLAWRKIIDSSNIGSQSVNYANTAGSANSVAWGKVTGKPTTVSGYGITDAYTKTEVNNIAAKYLLLAGGTMTGVLALKGGMYEDAYNGALNMQNSNIFGLNSIYTSDKSDSQGEGIHFYRDATHVDTLRMTDGKLLFTPNRELGNTATEYEVIHSGTIGSQSVNYAKSAGNADTLDNIHASGLFTALANSGNNLSVTIGGTNKTLVVGYAAKAAQLYTARTLWGNSFDGTANISGQITFPNVTSGFANGVKWQVGDNDYAIIRGGATGSNGGYLEIATADETNEPIYVRQYSGVFTTIKRTLTLLDASGNTILPGKLNIGGIVVEYDATNKALKVNGNLYATGGITAYGEGSAGTTGSNNFSAKAYADSIKLTSENLSEIASAYSIAVLNNSLNAAIGRISTLEGGSATSIETTGSGNAVTSVSKSGTKITFTKGSTFSLNGHTHTFASLTSKPTSLSGYGITDGVNAVSVTGSGNAVTAASVSGHTLTLTKGSSFSLSNHTHYIGTTQVQGSSAEQALTGITKIDNILKLSKASVTVNTSYKAEQNRLVIYGSTYGNDANYIKSAGKLSYGDGGPQLVFSTNENPDASGIQSAALVYTDHDTIGTGVSLSFVTNQGDAYFIAPHIKALTAFQGNLAWSYITNKPTTLSGFGITDGLRSVTQPSGSNVFVTGISTSGTAITYTKSYTKKSLTAVGASGWTNASTDGNIIPDMSFIAYWNGAYSGTSSNLAYCNKGAFGSFAIKNSLAFSELTSKPTTISGYGITDAYTKSQVDAIAAKYLPLTGGTLTGQLKIVASALNGAYNGLLIGDDCYIGDCNLANTIGFMGSTNNNAGMVKFGKGGMQFGYNGSNHIASTTAQWTNLNADLLDGWHKDNIVWSGAVNSNTASLSHYWAKLFDITVTGNQYNDRSFTFLFSNGYNDTYSVVVLRIRQNGANDSGAYNFNVSLRELVGNMSSRLRVYYNNATGNVQLWGNCQVQYGSLSYTIIKKTGRTSADFTSQGTLVTNTSFSAAQSLPATTGDSPYTLLDGATRIGIVKQADQLVTARSIWGQSFNGTANVSGNMTGVGNINTSAAPAGTIYTNNWFRSKGSTGWYSEDHGGGWYMSDNTWIRSYGGKDVYLSNKLSVNGNVGIGTSAPSHKLHVLGEIYTTTKVNINGIILEKDSDGNLKVNGNLYATGGISAYGTSSAGSGGGLSGSVLAWDSAIKMPNATNGSSDTTKTESSFLASAWSIKLLYNKVTNLEGGSAMNVSVSGSGNAVTSISKSGTTISVVKGSTFLTAHQSLAGYMKTETADAKYMYHSRNNIVSDLNDFATKGAAHIYEMNNVTNRPNSNSWVQVMNWGTGDSNYGFLLANDYSADGHMYFRQKIAGSWKSWKTIIDSSNIGSQSVNYATSAGSVAWTNVSGRPSTMKNPSALSWSGYSSGSYDGSAAKSISIPNNTNQLTNGAGFITASASITGNAATATKVNHSLSVFGKSFNGSADVTVADTDLIASISTGTSNLTDKTEILTSYASDNGFNDSNAKNKIHRRPASAIWGYINSKTISNADKLDNVHLNGIFTALSNTNNGVSMTIGTVAKSLANMQVYSATKLVTARNIALNGDLTGSANFDGSANITINGYMSYCNAIVGNTNTYPWRRIAKVNEITSNYSDGCILLYISEGFNGGYYGIARVYINTDNLSTGANASCSIQWISRNGYGLDSLKIAMYKTTGKAYYDVFLKMRGAYASVVIRTLQDQRGGLGKRFTLVNSTETTNAASHTEAYATIENAATAIHNQAYTSIAQGSDVATVHNADMVDGIHASGLFTNLSNSGNSLSITVGGTNKTLTVNYASNAGNADTLDGVHASGLFTNLSNSGNNISITIGGTNKTLTVGYATKAAQLNTARTLWGQSFDGTGNVNGALSGATTISASNTISTTLRNGALKIGNKSTPISALDEQVIFNTGGAIRFGETAWDFNQWAGLKYNHSSKTIYLGIADGSVFNANSAQSGGKLKLINCGLDVPDNIATSGILTVGKNIRLINMATNVSALFAQLNGESLSIGYGSRMYATTQMWCNKFAIYCNEDIMLLNIDKVTATFKTNILATGGVTAYASSDARLKTDLRKLDYLGIIKAMGGTFGFAWKKDNTRSIGWIAQHVLCNPHLKDIVETDEKGYYKINYWSPKLIAVAFGAIEQVDDEVSRLKRRVRDLENEVEQLKSDRL